VATFILVVKDVLPNGVQSWAEVAALYQKQSGKLILQDHDDVKRYWIEKCCNKFKKPTGTPGDPKRDMILRCQQIQQQIHAAVPGGDAAIIGNRSHTNTPTVLVDGGVGIVVAEEVGIPTIPPLISQQLAEVLFSQL